MRPINPRTASPEATRIQERLNATGQTWADLGDALDASDQSLYYWRKKGVPKTHLATVASFLGCSIDWLITGERETLSDIHHRDFLLSLSERDCLNVDEWKLLRTMAESLLARSEPSLP